MMRLYLDTEFNGFGGELMSLALVPADPALPNFYEVVKWQAPLDPWVAKHVVPFLDMPPVSREAAGFALARYMCEASAPIVVADWPEDFTHLLGLLVTGPGTMRYVPDFDMVFKRLPGFNTATASKRPHGRHCAPGPLRGATGGEDDDVTQRA